MAEGVSWGGVGLHEVAIINIEAFGVSVLDLAEGLVDKAHAGRIIGFTLGNCVWHVAAWAVITEKDVNKGVTRFLSREMGDDYCLH